MRRAWVGIAIAAATGLVAFLVAYVLLGSVLAPAPPPPREEAPPVQVATPVPGLALDSVAPRIAAGKVAVAAPAPDSPALLARTTPGDRLDVLAVLPEAPGAPPLGGVVVRGATVLHVPSPAQPGPMLLEVTAEEGAVLSHLVHRGVRLDYALWSAGGPPPVAEPLDVHQARARLGLPPLVTPTLAAAPAAAATGVATPRPVPPSTPQPTPRPERYVVQPDDTLADIAARLEVDFGALWWANRQVPDRDFLLPGVELVVPKFKGFLYQVQRGDTWDRLGRRFGMPPERLREINELEPEATLRAGMKLFVTYDPDAR